MGKVVDVNRKRSTPSIKIDRAMKKTVQHSTPVRNVCVVGLGYIGLPLAALLASKGIKVHGVDINPVIVKTINEGKAHLYEPDLNALVHYVTTNKSLVASSKPKASDVFIICVPTPFRSDRFPDISYVESAILSIVPHLRPGNLVIVESTGPVGMTENIAQWIENKRPDLMVFPRVEKKVGKKSVKFQKSRIFLAYCPERVLPGQTLRELVENDRIAGGIDSFAAIKARSFYSKFVRGTIHLTHCRVAELCKLAENSFRDVNIAFANELSMFCDQLNIDVRELLLLANRHPRVKILRPGPGVGGHCIAVDPWFLISNLPKTARILRTARLINDSMPEYVVNKIKKSASKFRKPVVACLGLTYKANSDDLRESPATKVVGMLAKELKKNVFVVEPHLSTLPTHLSDLGVQLVKLSVALRKANVIVLLTDHAEFLSLDSSLGRNKEILDTRGVWHVPWQA